MYFFKLQWQLHGIHQLSSTANLARIWLNRAESAVLLSWWILSSYLYNFKNYIFEIRTLQGSKWYITCLPPFNFNLYVFIIWGVLGVITEIHSFRTTSEVNLKPMTLRVVQKKSVFFVQKAEQKCMKNIHSEKNKIWKNP